VGTVDAFLASEEKTKSHLFVWTTAAGGNKQQDDADSSSKPANTVHASMEKLPKTATCSIAFCRTDPAQAVTSAAQIQCMTLQTGFLPTSRSSSSSEGGESTTATEQDTTASAPTTVLQTLQIYTRDCFLPTIQSVLQADTAGGAGDSEILDALAGKIRELDVALASTSRSARLPHVVLQCHERIQAAASKKTGDKIDWDALGLRECLQDDAFLNTVQAGVSQWIAQIRKITVLPNTTPLQETDSSHAAADEVAFWTQLQTELASIQQQLKEDPAVELTLAMLRETKRFVATLALENNTGLEQAVAITTDINNFIKTYPLQQLQAARDFEKVAEAVNAIFDHLPKIRQSRYYSLDRSAALLAATTVVLRDSLLSILLENKRNANLLFMDYKEYENAIRYPLLDVLAQFDDKLAEWKDFFTDHARRRKLTGMQRVLEKLTLHHIVLKDRMEQLHEFRSQQERLREVVHTVLREEEPEAIQQVEQAPRQIFATLNILDLSPGGAKALESALEEYDIQMDALEERLARLLRDKLQACKVRSQVLLIVICVAAVVIFPKM